ncbi:hypothetical protein [Paraburkholderia fungorum]|uniref:Lipoprotein n=1 Tax=Paraburkholderia fungorum TaxID=134537 RepID=A0AAW3V3I4_9BURK|nr:hypothetical protein [Paraburkholderia fungorum]MBB4517418.1 hypothetical protein [Paraburkholderia fungorum]MBB6204486.1 hypothetical protein [Paraburkholderia fungorum]
MKKLLMVVVVALLAACSHKEESVSQTPAPESLVGTYSALDADGKYYARLKVTEESGKYVFYEIVPFSSQPGPHKLEGDVAALTQETLGKIVSQKIDFQVDGLEDHYLAIVKVPVGWTWGRFKSQTGYVMIDRTGPRDVKKSDNQG